MLFKLPRDCRTFVAINPAAQWGWQEHFLNRIVYLLELKLWQDTPVKKGQAAAHKAAKPKLHLPDFLKPKRQPSAIMEGVDQMTVDDVKSWLGNQRGV